jgi:hypothetical protein
MRQHVIRSLNAQQLFLVSRRQALRKRIDPLQVQSLRTRGQRLPVALGQAMGQHMHGPGENPGLACPLSRPSRPFPIHSYLERGKLVLGSEVIQVLLQDRLNRATRASQLDFGWELPGSRRGEGELFLERRCSRKGPRRDTAQTARQHKGDHQCSEK